jgi:hypothetical protein
MTFWHCYLVLLSVASTCWLTVTAEQHLLVSCLVFEDRDYIRQALRNLVDFTLPTTPIVIHFSRRTTKTIPNYQDMGWWHSGLREDQASIERRVIINPTRRETAHARGSILRAHFANYEVAKSRNIAFEYVMFHASTSRFLFPGVEEYIFHHEFVRIQHPPYFVFDIWGTRCTQFSAQKRIATETPIAKFFGAITPTIEAHYTGSCTEAAVKAGSMCNRAGFSQHEGSFFPRDTAETIINFLATTPHYNSTRFNETVAATRNNDHTHLPESMSILEWMPRVMGVAGASPEETWIPTFISLLPKLQKAYKTSRPSAPVDRHWTKRNEKVAICDVMAIIEYRDHSRCDFP